MADWAGAFEALGAGLQGKGNEYLLVEEERKKRLAELDEKRLKAMAMDFDASLSDLNAGNVGSAWERLVNRHEQIIKLGGDPTHTENLMKMFKEGRLDEAKAKLTQSRQAAIQDGFIEGDKYIGKEGNMAVYQGPTGPYAKPIEGLSASEDGLKILKGTDVDPETGMYFVHNPETNTVETRYADNFTPPKKEPEKPKDRQPQINKLRDSVRDSVKSSKAVETQYMKLKSSLQSGTAAGDMSAVFAYMKMLDPASTVREGEQAQARQAAGVPSQIIAQYNKLVSGETLTPEMRQDFLARGGEIFDAEQYMADRSIYEILQQAEQDGLTAVQILGKQRSNDFATRWEERQNKDKQKKTPAPPQQQQSIIQFLGFENQAGGQ